MLNQPQEQPKAVEKQKVEKFEMDLASTGENSSGLQKIEMEIAAAAELLRNSKPYLNETPPAGPSPEDLIRAVTKFEKSEQSRVVDVFE